MLVTFGVLSASASLSTWWASVLVVHAEGTLSSTLFSQADASIVSQLGSVDPAIAGSTGTRNAIESVLHDPAVLRDMASSTDGSRALDSSLSEADPALGAVVSQHPLSLDTGRHDLAVAATDLRTASKDALAVAICLCLAAMVTSRRRDRVLRHIARWATWTGGIGLLSSWLLPDAAKSIVTRGVLHGVVGTFGASGTSMRPVLLPLFLGGLTAYAAARVVRTGEQVQGGLARRPAHPWPA